MIGSVSCLALSSLSTVAANSPATPLEDMRHEFSRKGGLNEQMFAVFQDGGGLKALTQALGSVLNRIRATLTKDEIGSGQPARSAHRTDGLKFFTRALFRQ